MVQDEDLEAAVAEGIITQAQVDRLRAFALRRLPQSAAERVDEERFRFLKGFNDFFFAVGVALVGTALSLFAGSTVIANLVSALLIWLLAEVLVRRMRLALPGILLACFFLFFVLRAMEMDWNWIAQFTNLTTLPSNQGMVMRWMFGTVSPVIQAVKAFACALGALVFYARFKLPFALLLIAGNLVVVAVVAFEEIWPGGGASARALIFLCCGLAVFAVAMSYDLTDPERVTHRSDCAFWLHLLAAPLLVHSLIELVPGGGVLVVIFLTIVALSIDRRALFVSALGYLGIVIGTTLLVPEPVVWLASTLLILGLLVLVLGIGWQWLRRLVVSCLPPNLIKRLPPVAAAVR